MATTSACWRVINTAELLEQILLLATESDLSLDDPNEVNLVAHRDNFNLRRTLLCSQRVCTAFKDTIASSRQLQAKLFFSPPKPEEDQRPNPIFTPACHLGSINLSASSSFKFRMTGFWAVISLRSTSWPPDSPLVMAATREASWRRMYIGREVSHIRLTTEEVAGVYRDMVQRTFDLRQVNLTNSKMGELLDVSLEMWHEFLETLPTWKEAMRLAYGED